MLRSVTRGGGLWTWCSGEQAGSGAVQLGSVVVAVQHLGDGLEHLLSSSVAQELVDGGRVDAETGAYRAVRG